MDGKAYLELLQQRLQRYYDIIPLSDTLPYALQAELHAADEGYFIVPNLKTYSVQHHEYLYAAQFESPLALDQAEPYLQQLRERMQALKTTTEHMSSLFSLVFICEAGILPETREALIKFKYHKDYCLTLKGWSDLAIYIVDISQQTVYCNKAAQKNLKMYAFPTGK